MHPISPVCPSIGKTSDFRYPGGVDAPIALSSLLPSSGPRKLHILPIFFGMFLAAIASTPAKAQNEPARTIPGSRLQIGGAESFSQSTYAQHNLVAPTAFIEAILLRDTQWEAEARDFPSSQNRGIHTSTYLVGPRVTLLHRTIQPYTKLLVGRGNYSSSKSLNDTNLVVAFAFGVDWLPAGWPTTIRPIDVEFQQWRGLAPGQVQPAEIEAGVAVHVF